MIEIASLPLFRRMDGAEERLLATSLTILHLGTGSSYSILALYLIRHVHLNSETYGIGMSVAAFLGLLAGPVIGQVADRVNSYRLYSSLVWVMCLATLTVTFTDPWLALVLLSILTVCGRGSATVMGVLVGRTVPKDRRVRYRAVVKSLTNSAMVAGIGLGAVVLAVGSKRAFQVAFVAESLTLLLAGSLVWLVSHKVSAVDVESSHAVRGRQKVQLARFGVLRDLRFAILTVLNCVLMLSESMITVALPLWVATRMNAPLWLVSVGMVIYTGGIVLLQIPVSRRVSDLTSAARSGRTGGILLAVASGLFPLAAIAYTGPAATCVVIVLVFALVGGEVFYSAGSWGLVYGLAPEKSLGQYQGVFNTGWDVSMLAGPPIFAWLSVDKSSTGWIALGAVFTVCALLLIPVSKRNASAAATTEPVGSR